MQQDYNNTINLPKTEFPMRAGLPKREPGFLEGWEKDDLYHELMKRTKANRFSFCMTALRMPMVTCIWAMRSTRF